MNEYYVGNEINYLFGVAIKHIRRCVHTHVFYPMSEKYAPSSLSGFQMFVLSSGRHISAQCCRYKTQVTGHSSQVIVLPTWKVSSTFINANLRPN